MPKVPDTNTFKLSEVADVVQLDAVNHSITSVTDNSGKAQLNTSSTSEVVAGDRIIVSNTTYYDGVRTVLIVDTNYIVITAAYAGDDTGYWKTETRTLKKCHERALSIKYDPLYALLKDRQSNFRNYGPTGALTYVDANDNGGFYHGIHGNYHWFFCCSGNYGLRSYSVSTGGTLTLKDTDAPPEGEGYQNVWVQNNIVFVTSYDSTIGKIYIRSYTYSILTGALTWVNTIIVYSYVTTEHETYIWGDNSAYLFVTNPVEFNGIRVYSYDGSGILSYESTYDADGAYYYEGIHMGGSGFMFVAGNNGITTFTISGGVLSKVTIWNVTATTHYYLSTDGTYIYSCTPATYGMMMFTWNVSTGYLTFRDNDGSGYLIFNSSFHGSNFIYALRSGYIERFRRGAENTINYITAQAYAAVQRTFIWEHAPNILIVTHGESGIKTYSMDLG